MTFTEDIGTLLTAELPDTGAESRLFGALIRTPLLVGFVQELVETKDVACLRVLCHGTVELHKLTDRYGSDLPTLTDAPFDGCGPVTGAVRAVAALGLALVDEEDRIKEHLDITLAWLTHTRAVVGARWPAGRPAPGGAYQARMSAIIQALDADPHGTTVIVWLLALLNTDAKKGATAAVEVLLDSGNRGIRATLRCTTLRRLPAALVPDPRSMLLFSADAKFRSGLETAWQTAGTSRGFRSRRGTVLWSLSDVDGPVDHVKDISLTAAFTVLVDETRRLNRWVRGRFTLRRLSGSTTAIVGGVDSQGRMIKVSGYRNKFGAAADLDRVVVPADDLDEARDHARALQTSVIGVRSWRDAARHSRRADRGARLRVASVGIVVLLVAAGSGGFVWHQDTELQNLRDTAAKLRDEAYEQYTANDNPGLGLLLAMASDDIANQAGQKSDVLDSMARDDSSLRRILSPQEGQFKQLALSQNGRWGALSTTTGAVQILSAVTGDTAWRQKGSGAELPTPGVFVSALAMSPKGQRAAFASTDLRLTVVENKNSSWSGTAHPKLPYPSDPGPLHTERNAVDHLQFTADGQRIVAYSERVGLIVFDARHPDAAPKRCSERGDAQAMSTTKGEALLTKGSDVVRIDLTTCARSVVLTAPKGVQLHGAVAVEGDAVLAAATREAQVFTLRTDGSETLLSDRGPYTNVSITRSDGGVQVIASTDVGTFGWDAARRTQRFGFAEGGSAVMSNGVVLRHHGGVAELYDELGSLAMKAWNRYYGGMASVSWAGDNLVASGGRTLYVVPRAAELSAKAFTDPANYHRLLLLPESVRSSELATSSNGPWAATLYAKHGTSRKLAVINVEERRQTSVPLPPGLEPRHVAFVDNDLFVGSSNGDVRHFRFADGAWREAGSRRLPASVVALGGSDETDSLYAVVSKGSGAQPSVVGMRTSDLAVTAKKPLESTTALARVEVMRDGQVVVGTGAGVVTFFTQDLELRGRVADGALQFVTDLTEVPDRGQVLVSGENHSVVFDRKTLTAQDTITQGAPFLSADAPADGKVLATYSFQNFTVALWILEDPDLRTQICRAIGRELSRKEWEHYVGSDRPYKPVCSR
ncbi:hypothetical protein [Streptomyces sp. NPDC058398]|uniref:hypothetical protein n=1 Tax=Streptomyces sp. NPDC058398 TaxID=3346479 RepID=UPI0036632238